MVGSRDHRRCPLSGEVNSPLTGVNAKEQRGATMTQYSHVLEFRPLRRFRQFSLRGIDSAYFNA
jgi:hypothetical protein